MKLKGSLTINYRIFLYKTPKDETVKNIVDMFKQE